MRPARQTIVLCLAVLLSGATHAAEPTAPPAADASAKPDLREQVLRADEVLFDAFNRGDLEGVGKMFATDLEFYQDNEGLADYRQTLDDLRTLFARATNSRRELDINTVEIRPIQGVGAVEIGTHRFCQREYAQDICGAYRFVHLWRNTDGNWQLARVISYRHNED